MQSYFVTLAKQLLNSVHIHLLVQMAGCTCSVVMYKPG